MASTGFILTPEQKERVRQAAFKREAAIRQKVSVDGVVYANYSQAARATGISPRSIKRYAQEGVPPQARRNGWLSEAQYNLAKTIKLA